MTHCGGGGVRSGSAWVTDWWGDPQLYTTTRWVLYVKYTVSSVSSSSSASGVSAWGTPPKVMYVKSRLHDFI